MADSLVVTAGASNSDSYNSLAELETYYTAHGAPEGWSTLDDVAKCKHARNAAAWMDRRWPWLGLITYAVSPAQALAWPRSGAVDRDGRTIDRETIPTGIKSLHAEVTKLAVEDKLQLSALERGGLVASEQIGPISTSYFLGAPGGSSYPFLDSLASRFTSGAGLRLFSNGG
jgi:hypothetical protein